MTTLDRSSVLSSDDHPRSITDPYLRSFFNVYPVFTFDYAFHSPICRFSDPSEMIGRSVPRVLMISDSHLTLAASRFAEILPLSWYSLDTFSILPFFKLALTLSRYVVMVFYFVEFWIFGQIALDQAWIVSSNLWDLFGA
jgi:hypothetical protein